MKTTRYGYDRFTAAEVAALRAERDALRKGIQQFLDGDYQNPSKYLAVRDCPHGKGYWEDCVRCDMEHFEKLLKALGVGAEGESK